MTLYPPLLKRGIAIAPWLILIPQWAKGNAPYLAHEQVHAMQQEVDGVITFWWRYLTSKDFRLASEIEAYKAQIAAGASIYSCAINLSNGYGLDLTHGQAMELLK